MESVPGKLSLRRRRIIYVRDVCLKIWPHLFQLGPVLPRPVDGAHVAPLDVDGPGGVDACAPLAGSQLTFSVEPEHLVLKE